MTRRRGRAAAVAFLVAFGGATSIAAAQEPPPDDVIGEPLTIERPAPGRPITDTSPTTTTPTTPTTTAVRPTAVLGVELQRPAPLARTGIDAFWMTAAGLGLIALGDLLLWAATRRGRPVPSVNRR